MSLYIQKDNGVDDDDGSKGVPIMRNGNEKEFGLTTTYFFSDFEDGWSANDLFFEFKEPGEIKEIVIPAKKDWRGKKYGFVRFINITNKKLVETKLNNTWLNGKKINANITNYKRREVKKLSLNHESLRKKHEVSKGKKWEASLELMLKVGEW